MDNFMIVDLPSDKVAEAIMCIHKGSEANKRDYPDDFIDEINDQGYTIEWLSNRINHQPFYVGIYQGNIVVTGSYQGESISNIFVDSEFQGMGFGKRMMDFIETKIKETGFGIAKLTANLTSVGFYKHIGYEVIREKLETIKEWEIQSFECSKKLL